MPRKAKSKKIKAVEKVRESEHFRMVSKDSGIDRMTKLTLAAGIDKLTERDKALLKEIHRLHVIDDSHPKPEYVEPPWDHLITEAENEARIVLEHPTTNEEWKEDARQVLNLTKILRSDFQTGEGLRESAHSDLAAAESLSSGTPEAELLDAVSKGVWDIPALRMYVLILEGQQRSVLNWAYHLGCFVERMRVRRIEPLVLVGRETAMLCCGCVLRVTDQERRILVTLGDAPETGMALLVKKVWSEHYDGYEGESQWSRRSRLGKYRKAINGVNDRLIEAGVPFTLHVRGDKLIAES